jgi:hypothetical protein
MKVVRENITVEELKKMSEKMFGGLVKAVVDIEKEIMVVDAELHADEELLLLEEGSEQKYLWGINIHPDKAKNNDWIVFDSMINLRPSWGNKSRGVDDPKIQEKIRTIVNQLVVL